MAQALAKSLPVPIGIRPNALFFARAEKSVDSFMNAAVAAGNDKRVFCRARVLGNASLQVAECCALDQSNVDASVVKNLGD